MNQQLTPIPYDWITGLYCIYYKCDSDNSRVKVQKIIGHAVDNIDYVQEYEIDILNGGLIIYTSRKAVKAYPSLHRTATYTY